MTCACPQPRLCEALGRCVVGRLWDLWNSRADYRRSWCERAGVDLERMEREFPPTVKPPRVSMECVHRGEHVRDEVCKPCEGRTKAKVYACGLHGECSLLKVDGVKPCVECGHKDAGPGSTPMPFDRDRVVRNVFMHLWPRADAAAAWKWNVRQLCCRLHRFNGRRLVYVVEDGGTSSRREIEDEFGAELGGIELRYFRNDPDLREVVTFERAVESLRSIDPNEITAVCHGKGVRPGWTTRSAARRWASALWRCNLDTIPLVERLFEAGYVTVGAFKRRGQFTRRPACPWHYSGSFHWFRHAALYTRPLVWDRWWAGMETFPGQNVREAEAGTLYIGGAAELDGYKEATWDRIEPNMDIWLRETEAFR